MKHCSVASEDRLPVRSILQGILCILSFVSVDTAAYCMLCLFTNLSWGRPYTASYSVSCFCTLGICLRVVLVIGEIYSVKI